MRLLALTCEVLARSVYLSAARSPNVVDVRLNRRGLHEDVRALRSTLQEQVDGAHSYDAVVLAYGLCGGALAGLQAGPVPLVIGRAHDCITLFLGSRDRYATEAAAHPGTFWYVQDYLERTDANSPFAGLGAVSDEAARAVHAEYVAKYGPDNADYLMEVLGAWREHYDRAAFIDTAVAPDAASVEARAREEARARGWEFERVLGELVLVRRLIDGDWGQADFLVVRPGERIEMSHDEAIVRAVPV